MEENSPMPGRGFVYAILMSAPFWATFILLIK